MSTPLTEEQMQLLSAWLDGETTEAEKQIVEQLLLREDAKQYLESLRATTALVSAHGGVRAPVGLSGRVLGALENDFKPKAHGPGSEPFESVPILSWRTPLYAAAAAIVVSLGIMFGPSLLAPNEGTPQDVARTALDNLPTPERMQDPPREQGGNPEDSVADEVSESLETLKARRAGRGSLSETESLEKQIEDRARETGKSAQSKKNDTWGDDEEMRRENKAEDKMAPRHDPALGKITGKASKEKHDEGKAETDADDEQKGGVGGGSGGADRAPGSETPKTDESSAKKFGERKEQPAEEAPAQEPRPADSNKPESSNADSADEPNRRADARGLGGEKDGKEPAKRTGDVVPPTAPAPGAKDSLEEEERDVFAAEVVVLSISEAATLAAQTDVLWVASLYGTASVDDTEDTDLESVSVELDADKLPELMLALRKLAKDQGYGTVDGNTKLNDIADLAGKEDTRGVGISGYLPVEEVEQPATNAARPEPAEKPAKVKLVIQLKK